AQLIRTKRTWIAPLGEFEALLALCTECMKARILRRRLRARFVCPLAFVDDGGRDPRKGRELLIPTRGVATCAWQCEAVLAVHRTSDTIGCVATWTGSCREELLLARVACNAKRPADEVLTFVSPRRCTIRLTT